VLPADQPQAEPKSAGLSRRAALALGAGGLGLAGVAHFLNRAKGQRNDGATSLRVLGNPYIEGTYRQLVQAYSQVNAAVPIDLAFSPRENDDTLRELLLGAFTGAPLPDVAFVNGNMIRPLMEHGLAAPLDDLVKRDTNLSVAHIGDRVYGVRFGLSVPVVVFNTRLVEYAGATPSKLPSDWTGVVELARRINRANPGVVGGFIEHDDNGALAFMFLLASYGLTPLSPDETHIGFANTSGVQALEVLRGFGQAGQASKDMGRRQARRTFQAGGIGIFVTMSSVLRSLTAGPESQPIVVKPLPHASVDGRVPAAGPVGVILARARERTEQAMEFLRFAGSDGQAILAQASGYLPTKPGFPGNGTATLSDFVEPSRIIDWYAFPGPNASKIANFIKDVLQQVVTLQMTPSAGVEAVATHMRKQLSLAA
jgi:multiple sugar transport system substrate-binding protein